MQRRTFLAGLLAGGALGLSGCQSSSQPTLDVRFLERSLSPQILKAFRRTLASSAQLEFEASAQLASLFEQLQQWRSDEPAPPLWRRWLPVSETAVQRADWLTLSDYWLGAAVQQQLIQPIEPAAGWQQLPAQLRQLMQRNAEGQLARSGSIWGAPYRTQGLMLVYDQRLVRQLGWQPSRWRDLWQPELQGDIVLPNHPRLVLGIALKSLGYSINDAAAIAQASQSREHPVAEQLTALHRQTRVYDSDTYLKVLISEDASLAVGWSSDVLSTLNRYPQLRAVYPQAGTILSSDVWVKPAQVETAATLGQQWLEFCWQRPVATQITLSTRGFSPIFLTSETLPASLQGSLLLPSAEVRAQSEFLQPLPDLDASLWTELS
ncbi:MAG: extracellular solute-binding protein [Leptolyngbya sp. SIO4C1]|nr:extracellular solute-binding protein [Leptolyngbya sp. SIO4C1]